jgi:hypothetical protein
MKPGFDTTIVSRTPARSERSNVRNRCSAAVEALRCLGQPAPRQLITIRAPLGARTVSSVTRAPALPIRPLIRTTGNGSSSRGAADEGLIATAGEGVASNATDVGVAVGTGVLLAVDVGVGVGLGVLVAVGVGVGVRVGVRVGVGVGVGLGVGLGVFVAVGVGVGVAVAVAVAVGVSVAIAATLAPATLPSALARRRAPQQTRTAARAPNRACFTGPDPSLNAGAASTRPA